MKKILVIGNSHVGAIKKGIESLPSTSNLSFSYIALPGQRFAGFRLFKRNIVFPKQDQKFIRDTFGINEALSVDDFDLLLYVAGRSRLHFGLYSSDRRIPALSYAVIEKIIKCSSDPFYESIQATIEPSRLVFLGGPLKSSNIGNGGPRNLSIPMIETPCDTTRLLKLSSAIRKICETTVADRHSPSLILPPPYLLTCNHFNTLEKYLSGGLRVNGTERGGLGAKGNADMSHANYLYGQEMSRVIVDFIASGLGSFQ